MQVDSVTVRVSGVRDDGNRQVAMIIAVVKGERLVQHGAHSDVADWVPLDALLGAVGSIIYRVESDQVPPHLVGSQLVEALEHAEESPF